MDDGGTGDINGGNAALASLPAGGIAAVFGATGGIGSALHDRLARSGHFAAVHGFSRADAFDLTDEASIAAAAERLGPGNLRLVIDATGFLHDAEHVPEKAFRDLDPAHFARSFALNATGPALIMKHVLPRLPREGKSVFATLSARVGSIGDNRLGGWYAYRAAKAALNQIVRTAAIELRRSRPEALCLALHPGTVATPLSGPFQKTGLDVLPPPEAARRILAVIDGLGPQASGSFHDHRGEVIPW